MMITKKNIKYFIATITLLFSAFSANAQLYTTLVDETFSTPAHEWVFDKVEYYDDGVKCYFKVKSTAAKVYLRLLPGCYLIDNEGNKYKLLESDLTSEAPGVRFSVAGEPLFFYMKFEPMKKGVNKMSLVLPELKVIEDIRVGDGTVVTKSFGDGIKSEKENLWIKKVVITDDYTAVTFDYDNVSTFYVSGYFNRPFVAQSTQIVADGVKYPLLPGEGKSWSLDKRVKFSFTIRFAPIPKNTRIVSFTDNINMYGIKLK